MDNRIEMLGVREKSGAELIERLTGRRAVVVLDPTLLLNKEEWAQAIPVKPVLENDYIFCYFLGANSEHRKVAEELSKKTGIPLYDQIKEKVKRLGIEEVVIFHVKTCKRKGKYRCVL